MAGLTENGLEIKNYAEVLDDLESSERANIDPAIDARDDEVLGQLNAIWSLYGSEAWQILQALNDTFNIDNAEGAALYNIGVLFGLSPFPATRSSNLNQIYTATNGAVMTPSILIQNPNTGDQFRPFENTTIDALNCYGAQISVSTVADSTLYDIEINNVSHTYTSGVSATENDIAVGLDSAINSGSQATSSLDGNKIIITEITEGDIKVELTPNLQFDTVSGRVNTVCTVAGSVTAPVGVVKSILIGGSGLVSTTNLTAYTAGRDTETDDEFRIRIKNSRAARGTATVDAITAALLEIPDVDSAVVFENDSDVVDGDGRPPHSFEAFVTGATDDEIAQVIWETRAAGIKAYGNTTGEAVDRNGTTKFVSFSRPVEVNINVTVFADPATIPDEYDTVTFAAACVSILTEYLQGFKAGEDVIYTKIYTPLYQTFPDVVFSQASVNSGTVDIVIDANEVAVPDSINLSYPT